MHVVEEGLSFQLRGRDFLQIFLRLTYGGFIENCNFISVTMWQAYRTQVVKLVHSNMLETQKFFEKFTERLYEMVYNIIILIFLTKFSIAFPFSLLLSTTSHSVFWKELLVPFISRQFFTYRESLLFSACSLLS